MPNATPKPKRPRLEIVTILSCCDYLGGGAGLHGAELLVPLGVPQLVQAHIQHHEQLQAAPQQAC